MTEYVTRGGYDGDMWLTFRTDNDEHFNKIVTLASNLSGEPDRGVAPFSIRIHKKPSTLGWTFVYKGEKYGDYIHISPKDNTDEAMLLLVKQALQTLEDLMRR